MRVIVSGATGFMGGHLCRYIRSKGHAVIGLGRDLAKGAVLVNDGITFHPIDLSLPLAPPAGRGWPIGPGEGLNDADADAFVHGAALSSNWGPDAAFHAANVTGTQTALELAESLNIPRFIHISSPSVAFRFRHQLNQTETDPLPAPVNAYAASKQQAETLVRARANTVILRPRGIYGRGDTALLPRLIRAATRRHVPLLNHGEGLTDLTHIDDVIAAIDLSLHSDATGTFNISGGEPVMIRSIIEQACAHAGISPRFVALPVPLVLAAARTAEIVARLTPGQPEPVLTAYSAGVLAYSQTLDLTAARRDLGYSPKVTFADGLKRTFS